jgi:hypothetical protein
MNAVEIEEAVSSLGSADFDAKEFPFAFLAAFGNKETTIKRLRSGSSNASDVQGGSRIDVKRSIVLRSIKNQGRGASG